MRMSVVPRCAFTLPSIVLDHRMDGALRLHHHLYAVVRHSEQMMRLDNLQTLVHERGRIDGDLRPHVPCGMRQRLLHRDICKFFARFAAERATGRRNPQATYLCGVFAQQALVDGAMLGVDGKQRLVRTQGHQQVTAHDQRLLVRQCQLTAGLQRGIAGAQTGGTHQRVDHQIRPVREAQPLHRRGTERDFHRNRVAVLVADGGDAGAHLFARRCIQAVVPHRSVARLAGTNLPAEHIDAVAHSKRHDVQAIGMTAHHIQSLAPDRSTRTQHDDASSCSPPFPQERQQIRCRACLRYQK